MGPIDVLIVGGDIVPALELREALADAGYQVGSVFSVARAVARTEVAPVRCAVLNADLKDDVVRDVAAHLTAKAIPYIVVTPPGATPHLHWTNAASVIPSPYRSKQVAAAIQELLATRLPRLEQQPTWA